MATYVLLHSLQHKKKSACLRFLSEFTSIVFNIKLTTALHTITHEHTGDEHLEIKKLFNCVFCLGFFLKNLIINSNQITVKKLFLIFENSLVIGLCINCLAATYSDILSIIFYTIICTKPIYFVHD